MWGLNLPPPLAPFTNKKVKIRVRTYGKRSPSSPRPLSKILTLNPPLIEFRRALPGTKSKIENRIDLRVDFTVSLTQHCVYLIHLVYRPTCVSPSHAMQLAEPLAVAIPHCAPRNASRETVVKQRMPNGQWREIPSYDVVIEDIKVGMWHG